MNKGGDPGISLGIIGSGRIACRFLRESEYVDGIHTAAVYNPNLNSARTMVEKYIREPSDDKIGNVIKATDDLEEFFDLVDAVYIAAPHHTHFEYARTAINNEKHALCEKPMVLSRIEAEELYRLSEEKGVVLLEALKTAFMPGFNDLMRSISTGKIGSVTDINACFTKLVRDKSSREWTAPFGGSFTELGSYSLLPILTILGTEYAEVTFTSIMQDNIDIYTKAAFVCRDKPAMAEARTGIGAKSEGELIISGTEGTIYVPAPWWIMRGHEIHFEDTSLNERIVSEFEGDGLRYEIAAFRDMINNGVIGKSGGHMPWNRECSVAAAYIMEGFCTGRKVRRLYQ